MFKLATDLCLSWPKVFNFYENSCIRIVGKYLHCFFHEENNRIICDVMRQNQSHVAKHETVLICILSENVKICSFFVFIKNKIFVKVCVS